MEAGTGLRERPRPDQHNFFRQAGNRRPVRALPAFEAAKPGQQIADLDIVPVQQGRYGDDSVMLAPRAFDHQQPIPHISELCGNYEGAPLAVGRVVTHGATIGQNA